MTHDARNSKPPDDNILRLIPTHTGANGADPLSAAETTIADEFVRIFGGELVYVPEWSQWMLWLGTHWREDKLNRVRHMVREVCESFARDTKKRAIASAKTITAVETTAKAHLAIAAGATARLAGRGNLPLGNVCTLHKSREPL